ncbi:hypothetical protein C8T65DRAFT_740562 [Cerioporus squamosus]|nr:hypothetical protein C8T65DRAFT_740562 [Cerioporus squamosus]
MASTIVVHRLYARWRDQFALSLPDQPLPASVHAYCAPSPLPAKMQLGDHVQVIAISPMVYRTLHVPPGTNLFDVYDPQIVGQVEGMRSFGSEKVVLLVRNARAEHGVQWAVVAAPPVPGEAPDASGDGHLAEWMARLLEDEGRVADPKCVGAVVVDNLGGGVTPPVKCRFPDPKTRRRDRKITDQYGAWKPGAS